jgi:hypothetical protein
MELQG